MRIVGGRYRGRVLRDFSISGIRPTSDMARESLFNVINASIVDKTFLDLFSGTGAIGIEALSRGAKRVVFCDNSKDSVNLITENLKIVNNQDYSVVFSSAETFIKKCNEKFDFVYIDPPYKSGLIDKILPVIGKIVSKNGVVITENEEKFFGEVPSGFDIIKEKRYGRAYLTFFIKNE